MSAYANNLSAQNQACFSAYASCRKYQDAAAPAITACQQSPSGIASKLKALTQNKNKIDQAQAAIGQLVTKNVKGNAPNTIKQQDSIFTCKDTILFANELNEALQDNPASLKIARLAEKVVNASKVVCSNEEIANLLAVNKGIDETEEMVDKEIINSQNVLEGMQNIYRDNNISFFPCCTLQYNS